MFITMGISDFLDQNIFRYLIFHIWIKRRMHNEKKNSRKLDGAFLTRAEWVASNKLKSLGDFDCILSDY